MAHSHRHSSTKQVELSSAMNQILVMGPPTIFTNYEKQFNERFDIINPYKSSLPLDQFISTHPQAHSIQSVLCSGGIRMNASILDHLPALRLIVTPTAGINHIDLPYCRLRGIAVANTGTVSSIDVAEFAVGLLIDVVRKISVGDRFVRYGLWPARPIYTLGGTNLRRKRVGIVGLGSIGLEVAKRLEAFGCIISYLSRSKKSPVTYPFYTEVTELATNSDILIISCALNDQTRDMINKEVLLALGNKGVVINIARGAIIVEKDLIECLQKGEIGGAGLDVFEKEPVIPKELLGLDNVVMTPHVAFFTEENMSDTYELLCGNLEAFFSNKSLLTPVLD